MYEFFGGVTPILVSDNAPTATNRKQSDKYESVLIKSYEELAPVSYTHLDVYKRQVYNFRLEAGSYAVCRTFQIHSCGISECQIFSGKDAGWCPLRSF